MFRRIFNDANRGLCLSRLIAGLTGTVVANGGLIYAVVACFVWSPTVPRRSKAT
jgi:hypothetical protein